MIVPVWYRHTCVLQTLRPSLCPICPQTRMWEGVSLPLLALMPSSSPVDQLSWILIIS